MIGGCFFGVVSLCVEVVMGKGTAGKNDFMKVLTPREIVSELDKYIIGQDEAKRSVAIALRNRWRRQQVPPELRDEIAPKNIIMIGPTGVGKTEIARRLARLANSPFQKVEATKFTEVGYVGRDVESMVRDLADLAVNMTKKQEQEKVKSKAREMAVERMSLFSDRKVGTPVFRPGLFIVSGVGGALFSVADGFYSC